MKPLLIALTFLVTLFTQPSFATEHDVTPTVLRSFQTTFSTAKDVEWSTGGNYYKAQFDLSGQVVSAYYSTEGQLMAVTRNITTHQLPLALQTALRKGNEEAWVTDLFEMSNEEGTSYYVTLETGDSKVVLKSSGQGWTAYSKTKKD